MPLSDDIRSAISNAYYENRGKGQTMETAADAATAAVMALLAARADAAEWTAEDLAFEQILENK